MAATVCIVNGASTAVNESLLGHLKIRRTASAVPDMILSSGGTTAAFLLYSASGIAAKVEKLGKSFKHAYVLIPHELLGDPGTAADVCRLAARGVSFVYMPAGANFTAQALSLSAAAFTAAGHEKQWRAAQAEAVQGVDAINGILAGLPLPPHADPAHMANMLRMLGSLRHISQCPAQQLAAHTGLDAASALAIEAFFHRS